MISHDKETHSCRKKRGFPTINFPARFYPSDSFSIRSRTCSASLSGPNKIGSHAKSIPNSLGTIRCLIFFHRCWLGAPFFGNTTKYPSLQLIIHCSWLGSSKCTISSRYANKSSRRQRLKKQLNPSGISGSFRGFQLPFQTPCSLLPVTSELGTGVVSISWSTCSESSGPEGRGISWLLRPGSERKKKKGRVLLRTLRTGVK